MNGLRWSSPLVEEQMEEQMEGPIEVEKLRLDPRVLENRTEQW